MTIVTPGIVPASVLLAEPRPAWQHQWARFAASLRFAALPPALVAQAKLVMLDCIGAVGAGMQEPEVAALAGRLARRGADQAFTTFSCGSRYLPRVSTTSWAWSTISP